LREHLTNVGKLAAAKAAAFGCGTLAEPQGQLHDLGKYTDDFQRRLAGDAIRVDHATRGAMIMAKRYGPAGYLLAYGIAGHHAGLANGAGSGQRTPLQDRLRGIGLPPLLDQWQNEITLPATLSLPELRVHISQRRVPRGRVDRNNIKNATRDDVLASRPSQTWNLNRKVSCRLRRKKLASLSAVDYHSGTTKLPFKSQR
jgi:CRISPR-associated endonuclease Cas3-HD